MENRSAYCLLPSAFCLLPSAFCLLPSAFCLLPSAFCLLPEFSLRPRYTSIPRVMSSTIIEYLSARPDSNTFLVPLHYAQTLEELFPRTESVLPQPYKIFMADETQPAVLGFPLAETPVMKELDTRLDHWLTDEVAWQVSRKPDAKEKAQASITAYLTQLLKVSENAMMSNLLNDYHAVFWLAHSIDLARNFSSIPRRVSSIDTQSGRTQGDALKYRIFAKWTLETRELMMQLAAKAAAL